MVNKILIACMILLSGLVAAESAAADPNTLVSSSILNTYKPSDSNGPTVIFDYNEKGADRNATSSFMYFVPLVSPVLVDCQTSPNNLQRSGVISLRRKIRSKSFCLQCEFQMQGAGSHSNFFDPLEIIKKNTVDLKEGETLKHMLDFIKFEGEGYGRLTAKGKIVDGVETVTEVVVNFSSRKQKSPVTIGLYSIDPVDGQYKYEDRYNKLVARINTLTFRRTEGNPKMAIKVDSLSSNTESNGIWGRIKGTIANFFIPPLEVDKVGNQAMLDLGYAFLKKKPTFTFPKARNLKTPETKMAGGQWQHR